MNVPVAHGEPAFCLNRVKAYVKEIDELLAKEKNSLGPFDQLNDRYFPFVDCDPDALLEEFSRSRFFQQITYNPRAREYSVFIASSEEHDAIWVNK